MGAGIEDKGLGKPEFWLCFLPQAEFLQISLGAIGDVEVNGTSGPQTDLGIAQADGAAIIPAADTGTAKAIADNQHGGHDDHSESQFGNWAKLV